MMVFPGKLLMAMELTKTQSEARRAIEQGAMQINGKKVAGTPGPGFQVDVKAGDLVILGYLARTVTEEHLQHALGGPSPAVAAESRLDAIRRQVERLRGRLADTLIRYNHVGDSGPPIDRAAKAFELLASQVSNGSIFKDI
jgi:ribosomal 50S subunit-recycling heat shock protein